MRIYLLLSYRLLFQLASLTYSPSPIKSKLSISKVRPLPKVIYLTHLHFPSLSSLPKYTILTKSVHLTRRRVKGKRLNCRQNHQVDLFEFSVGFPTAFLFSFSLQRALAYIRSFFFL